MDSKNQQEDFKKISQAVMKSYQEQMHEYLNGKAPGTLTDADVVLMVMNLTISIGTNIYYSVKQYLPSTKIDFDFMRAKMTNSLAENFEKIKEYNPSETMTALTTDQVKEILEKGEVTIELADGTKKLVKKEDIIVKKEDADKILEKGKQEAKNANTPKIVSASGQPLR